MTSHLLYPVMPEPIYLTGKYMTSHLLYPVMPEPIYLTGYGLPCSINITRKLILNKLTMSSTTLTFSESDKFNGTNWASWRRLIRTMAVLKGAFGYLDGSIKQPFTLPNNILLTETPWDSEIPSPKEWRA